MVDEREEWLTRRFALLEDVDVPELWEQIVVRADTEPNLDLLPRRRRRWVPLAAAAAVMLVLAGIGLIVWAREDPSQVDNPPGPAAGDNTVQIVHGDDDQAIVTTTAVAGAVSFDITNATDRYWGVHIQPMLPGATIEDIRVAAVELAQTGAVDTSDLLADPVLGVVSGPHDHFVTTMPLAAGEYAVILTRTDARLAPEPDDDGHEVRQLTVTAGNAGSAPAATLRFDRMAEDYLTGDTAASRGPATIRVDNTAGGPFELAIKELRPDATRHDYDLWTQSNGDEQHFDWSTAPIATIRVFYAGAAQQTVTIDLAGGDLEVDARPSFHQGGLFSVVWVTVQ